MFLNWPNPTSKDAPLEADYEEVKRRVLAFDPNEEIDVDVLIMATRYLKEHGYLDVENGEYGAELSSERSDEYFVYSLMKWMEQNT
jgi:hypothetical protein